MSNDGHSDILIIEIILIMMKIITFIECLLYVRHSPQLWEVGISLILPIKKLGYKEVKCPKPHGYKMVEPKFHNQSGQL